jgi:IMP dehydrogenase
LELGESFVDLMFGWEQILTRGRGLTFDDVLLVPRFSEISSRQLTALDSRVTKNFTLKIPVVTANMDTVTESKMASTMASLGGLGILHRFMSAEQQVVEVEKIRTYLEQNGLEAPIAASVGVKEDGMKRADMLADQGVNILTVDIAHGDSIMMLETLDYIKKKYPQIDVIAGNVATSDGVKRMVDHGADAIKVGIGPGSMCTTRIITGHGVPQLTAVALAVSHAKEHGVPVIADGGIRTSGDIVKALTVGASTVMLGSMVAGTTETPGEVKGGRKSYRGMASKEAQVSWRGELPKGMAAEGVATTISCKGSVVHLVKELTGGIRSGMTYLGVDKIEQMQQSGLFMEISAAGMTESKPHGL